MTTLRQQFKDAAESGDLDGMQAALSAGADIGDVGEDALFLAADNGHTEAVEWLLSVGADPQANNSYAFQSAAKQGDLDIVKILLAAGADIHADDDLALRWAAESGQLDVVRYLLDEGANPHAMPEDENLSALHLAIKHGHLEVVACLLTAGAEPEPVTLLMAALAGDAQICRLLRQYGAELSISMQHIHEFIPDVQIALLDTGDVDDLAVPGLARRDVCPAALIVLLKRQGHAELATMLTATQMLEPMAPDERGAVLADLMAQPPMAVVHVGL